MKKQLILTLALVVSAAMTHETMAQQKKADDSTTKVEQRSAENIQKEADALKTRIDQVTQKVEANKDSPNVDYDAEQTRLAELRKKWETLTGKTWKEEAAK